MPPLEMMACGGAVLASTAGAVVETAGNRAHLLDPLDREGWTQAMQRVVMDDRLLAIAPCWGPGRRSSLYMGLAVPRRRGTSTVALPHRRNHGLHEAISVGPVFNRPMHVRAG